jgi:hypothetical protein
MKPTTLYKKDCEPYVVHSNEALTFHLNQGWVENEADIEKKVKNIMPVKPYNVLTATPTTSVPADSGEIKSLREALAAKDQVIADMQVDFDEIVADLNATIARLKGDTPVDFGLPAAPAPKDPSATWIQPSEGPTNAQLREQLDAAGIKHTPRDNKTSLLALVATIPTEG